MGHDTNVKIARAALVRILKMDQSIRHNHEWHVQFIKGYVEAIQAMETGALALLSAPSSDNEGYIRGFNEALRDYGVRE